MAPIVLVAMQAVFLLLLYLFVARAVRAVVKDLRPAPATGAPVAAAPARSSGSAKRAAKRSGSGERRRPPGELVVHVPGGRPRVLELGGGEITFGRSEMSTVMLTDSYVSERHARVYQSGGQWLVADMGSTNGTYLNQVKVTEPKPIAAGDQLGIGKIVVEVRK
jgi:pSer/pThr/pTyr-binding forkhead associated (FHA) protein